jgi:hypothetical protein
MAYEAYSKIYKPDYLIHYNKNTVWMTKESVFDSQSVKRHFFPSASLLLALNPAKPSKFYW